MTKPRLDLRQWVGWTGFLLVFLLSAALAVWQGDILRAGLDPQVPFQTYEPPPPPDYLGDEAWALNEARVPDSGMAAIFFVHSTTYDGGREWNGSIVNRKADAYLQSVVLPNYAGPFARAGAVSAPRYRQGSLYTRLTLREDAREARAYAFQDIKAAFEVWIARHKEGPIVLAGVEQGGELLERLLHERIAPDGPLRNRLAVIYLIDVVAPADRFGADTPLCSLRQQAGCVMVWAPIAMDDGPGAGRRLRRALTWNEKGQLAGVDDRPLACVNPVTGSVLSTASAQRQNVGATNATGLEWGARPALLGRVVAAECRGGLLRYSLPESESLQRRHAWVDRWKSMPYNLFYGDIERDVQARLATWTASDSSRTGHGLG